MFSYVCTVLCMKLQPYRGIEICTDQLCSMLLILWAFDAVGDIV